MENNITFDYELTKTIYEESDDNLLIKCWSTNEDMKMTDIVELTEQEEIYFWNRYKREHPDMLRDDRIKKINSL